MDWGVSSSQASRPRNVLSVRSWRNRVCRLPVCALKGFLTFPLFARDEDWYAFVFVVDEFAGELINSPEGDLEWIDDELLLSLNLWQGDRIFLPLLDQPGLFSAKIVYQEGQLVSHTLVIYPP